jgi:hypothetical protein
LEGVGPHIKAGSVNRLRPASIKRKNPPRARKAPV